MTIAMRGGGSNQPQQPPVQQNQQQVGLNTNPKNGGENQKEFQLPDFPPVPHQAASTGVPLNNEAFNQIDKNTESESLNNENNVEKEMMNDEMMLEVREPDFPHPELAKLDEMINRPRWVVPVLPKGELEILLDASIEMCKNNIDTRSEACQRFFREGLTISFSKILTDEAVSGWKFEIHRCIMKNCEKLIELCVYKLSQDWFPLLDLLAMVLNPINKFHTFNGTRTSETAPLGSQVIDDEIYARSSDARTPQGWLVDLINRFGSLGGFQILLERFQNGPSLSVSVIAALIRPFGLCYEFLTIQTIEKFFMSIVEVVPAFLDNLTDEELKKEAKNEAKNDALSAIIKALKCLASRVPNQEETVKNLEMFRLKMILRLLQISSFNGKMNALNEVNKVITSVTYYPHRNTSLDEEVWLTAERMAKWIEENKVLQIVLRDSLHQPQYVEKLEKIIRFVIKEKSLTLDDLDNIWAVQVGKHEAIVKNVHDLLAKLAWDFSPEQLDHLFGRFQESWAGASQKQREKLLELIRRLAEDDKDGVMAHKVLNLLWNLAHSDDVPTEIVDQALSAHVKILDYSCSQDRDTQKTHWLERCIDELKNDKWVIPALKQIREICMLYTEAPPNYNHASRSPHMFYRHEVINRLQQSHSLVIQVADNLTTYITKVRQLIKENPDTDPNAVLSNSRYGHTQHVQERLNFLRFLLKDGQLWLCSPQARQIWNCLAENAVFVSDREACFKWFSKLMGEEPDLDPEINKDFFENNLLQLDPCLLTENGMKCFDRFFKAVNSKERKLIPKRRGFLMDDLELIGLDYLWRVVLSSGEEIANKAIELLKETYTNLGPKLTENQVVIHEDFIQSCMDRLKAAYDTISVLERDKASVNRMRQETTRMVRVLKVLYEYVNECDADCTDDRSMLPMARAHRGKHVTLTVRFSNQGRQVDDLEIWSHTNDTLGLVRRQVLNRVVKSSNITANVKIELYLNTELIDSSEDKKVISQIPLRDKTLLTGKVVQVGNNMPSSPDSSTDSSSGTPQHQYDTHTMECETPGVLMSLQPNYVQFLFQLADLGSSLQLASLRDAARALLKLMPADRDTVDKLRSLCMDQAKSQDQSVNPALQNVFFGSSPSQILYNLEVVYALLMPALNPMSEEALDFQYNFIKSGGVRCVLEMLTKNNFLPNADVATKRSAYYMVLKISKFLLTTVAHATVIVVAEACSQPESTTLRPVSPAQHSHAVVLQQALHHIPNASAECMIRNVSVRLAQSLSNQAISDVPDMSTIRAIIKLAWASSSAAMLMIHSSNEELHQLHVMSTTKLPDSEDVQVCKEGLEVLSIALALYPQALEVLIKDTTWHNFIIDLLLLCKIRNVRQSAAEQFVLIATKCSNGHQPLVFFITLLFTVLETTVNEHSRSCHEYFQLLCRLLSYASISDCQLPNAENLLHSEIRWLKQVRSEVLSNSQFLIEESLLEGHLGITRELLGYLGPDVKYEVGCQPDKDNLIKELVEDFLFPASKVVLQLRKNKEIPSTEQAIPVCSSAVTTNAAFDLLVALCTGCVPNLQLVTSMLTDMYYSEKDQPITEWEYLPPVGPRPSKGFVGLKNAGATCYMNSVLQQLYMIESIRTGILSTEGAAVDPDEDFSDEDKPEVESNVEGNEEAFGEDKEENRKEYNLGVMKQVQAIFGHLACSKLQYYVPRGFWKHFKLWGEPVNLREQHDALEFFNSLVDSLDEALKSLGQPTILSKILGGSFADQKICKDCPHRYSREESFTTLNIDIRNHSNLSDSLEQYVKGDLLEGANAYHCDKCNKKVDTVKRLCLKKLPPILTIQLKRFDYDWERECAIKFNDYFEFPRDLDMKPYTASGVAEIEGEVIEHDLDDGSEMETASTKYKLTGIVVHSGQASGGHYYSYIQHRHSDGSLKWYKFDDGEVSECKMDDDEEMKNQCFGGDYMGEVFDHMLKRMSYRRQKRWWNAYILVYRRNDNVDDDASRSMVQSLQELTLSDNKCGINKIKMPLSIEGSVRKQNVQYMHNKNQFSPEYFLFMKKLISCNAAYITVQPTHDRLSQEGEQLAMMSIQLASNFLFKTAFHTKKSLRGASNEWYDAICIHLRHSRMVRSWFAHNVLFMHSYRFGEYLLECPSSEVRTTFAKIIVFLAHFSLQDGPCPPPMIFGGGLSQLLDSNATLSDHILQAVLLLLKKEVSEHGRHLTQYFSLFMMYCSLGVPERRQLLQLNVVSTFINVALDDGPGPAIKYQYAELSKLYQVISILVRCCDISSKAQSSITNNLPLPNPHAGDHICPEYIVPVQPYVAEILLNKNNFLKKVIEDAAQLDETPKLLKFCCWENPSVSHFVLMELLWQIAYSYTYELKPYFDLLLHILLVEDSWQSHRIPIALKGVEDREGMFDTIKRNMTHHQKRAYQCIKFMVNLFNICQCAANMLQSNGELKRKWISAVNWLNKELEKHKPYPSNSQYPYNSWSPPAQSNETANGFFLERSHSARVTLAKAFELCPDEDNDEPELSEEGGPDSPINDDNKAPPYVQSINSQQQSACDHQQSSPGGNNSPGPSHPTLTQRLQQSPQLYMSPTHVPTPSNTRVQVVSGMMTIPANSHQKHSEDSSGSITTTTNPTNTTNSTTTTNAVVEDQ